jgi:hypothetical protein
MFRGLEWGTGAGEGGWWRRRAIITVGRGEERGKQAGEDPYPKWNSGGSSRQHGSGEATMATAAKVRRRRTHAARVCKARQRLLRRRIFRLVPFSSDQGSGSKARVIALPSPLTGLMARGGGFIGRPSGLDVRAQGGAARRTSVGHRFELESGSR